MVGLVLLLAPASRSYVWRSRPHVAVDSIALATPTADSPSDLGRPSGWYVDPDHPKRMRYWRADDAKWLGTTKTPRKIRRA